ncbi:AI-2E family transporter [Methylococcus capsulatus]|nr:AI-2E family transporter [Methylococcus capsulatus]QXP95225.1 AI-2E family transporter [Methylococcus capsulatus]
MRQGQTAGRHTANADAKPPAKSDTNRLEQTVRSMNRSVRLITIALLLAALASLTYAVVRPFLVSIGWAVFVSYVAWPLHAWSQRRFEGRKTLSALVTTALLGSVVLAPLIWLAVLLQGEVSELIRSLPDWLEQKPRLPDFVSHIPYFGNELQAVVDQFEDLHGLLKRHAPEWVRRLGSPVLGIMTTLVQNAAVLFMTLFTLFFLFRDGLQLATDVRRVFTRVLGERLKGYFATIEATVKAVLYGIVLTALAQGFLAGLGYWIVGVKAPIVLGIATTLIAMIPFGTPFAWGSVSIWLLLQGETWAGVSLALWGTLVISWIDNIIRPLVISSATHIPFVLVMFGVLGGLASFGFIGLVLGPVILAMALAVWREWLQQVREAGLRGEDGSGTGPGERR